MLAAAAIALSLWIHAPTHAGTTPSRSAERIVKIGPWRGFVRHDAFTGQASCGLATSGIHIRARSAIFRMGRGVETTHAVFRIDAGQPRAVSELFAAEARNDVFPLRGWIDDRHGGEVALPLGELEGAKRVFIRAQPGRRAKTFDVGRLSQALGALQAAGCPPDLP